MRASINNYLKKLAYQYYISKNSDEAVSIDVTYNTLRDNLFHYFGNNLVDVITFGSYDRDTILPRKYDSNSDIDIMIVFDEDKYDFKPETYRNHLIKFSDKYYKNVNKAKDFPTVLLDMKHIKFDLVPTIKRTHWLLGTERIMIPNRQNTWQRTKPHKFSEELIEKNVKYNSIVKPVIRLVKAWNAKMNYPYTSFELEQSIAKMNFSDDNYETGLFWAIDKLPTKYLSNASTKKVSSLQENKRLICQHLEKGNITKAKYYLHKILPN